MSETVVFSQLSRKFIDENDATPAEAQQVVYYSLAIGHHLGIIDCLEAALTCPWEAYLAWIATLEEGSHFGFSEDRDGVRAALLAKKAFVVYDAGGYSDLVTGQEALKLWENADSDVTLSQQVWGRAKGGCAKKSRKNKHKVKRLCTMRAPYQFLISGR